MQPLTSGTFAGAGSYCCQSCGYVLTLTGSEALTVCPGCGGKSFERASLFSAEAAHGPGAGAQGAPDAHGAAPAPGGTGEQSPVSQDTSVGGRSAAEPSTAAGHHTGAGQETARHGGMLAEPAPSDRDAQLARARAQITQPGGYLCYEEGGELRTLALTREWTRIGRSLAADVRFDDPTVSRRHALIVRQPDGVRVLDDRSLNGVFVNGKRVEGQMLSDGDEIIVGRYRLSYLDVTSGSGHASQGPAADSLHTAG